MWRKNRNPNAHFSCAGVDLNRNFNYMWLTTGASSDPCSEIYAVCLFIWGFFYVFWNFFSILNDYLRGNRLQVSPRHKVCKIFYFQSLANGIPIWPFTLTANFGSHRGASHLIPHMITTIFMKRLQLPLKPFTRSTVVEIILFLHKKKSIS